MHSSLNTRDQVKEPYKTGGKISFVYFSIYSFRQEMGRWKLLNWMPTSTLQISFILISLWIQFGFLNVFPKYLNFDTVSKDLLAIFMLWSCLAVW
jgi:hypothetical protein